MLQQKELSSLDRWREKVRLEIRNWIAQADARETDTHLRRRLYLLNPVRRTSGGVSAFRIRQLAWRQVLYEEVGVREAAIATARAFAELHEPRGVAGEPLKKKKERLKLVGRNLELTDETE